MEPIVLFGIILALALNFVNGLNDASHSIATVVATKALSPIKAVFSTAICNMIGPFVLSTAVAATIGTAIVTQSALTPLSIVVAMGASILLVFVATRMGIPLSSSHALVGGLLGAGIGAVGFSAIILPGMDTVLQVFFFAIMGAILGALVLAVICALFEGDIRLGIQIGAICGAGIIIPFLMIAGVIQIQGLLAIVLFIFISPLLGISGAFLFNILVSQLIKHSRQSRAKRIFQPLHVLACLGQATAHGANDGQHAVGVITALLVSSGLLVTFDVPTWVILASAIAIGLGTCFGGWKVIDKMAKEITKIRPYQGFCAATASSAILVMVTQQGIPVSSTHAINGAIIGVGATRGRNAVQWKVVREMMTAWVITIPLGLGVSWVGYQIVSFALTSI
ncbi:MAG: phosphate transporter [Methanomicrobiales archaeon HGW-Methanomicrobiales-1]|nr:MAG: phosphate transporter [Methanomicrobiales archaeon HGW-Methanomicrobiales-1]